MKKSRRERGRKIKDTYNNFFVSYSQKGDKKIIIEGTDTYENFNIFPFFSEFLETHKKYDNSELINILKKNQQEFFDVYQEQERDFYSSLDHLTQLYGLLQPEFTIKYYEKIVNESFVSFKKSFINGLYLDAVKHRENISNWIPNKGYIKTFKREITNIIKVHTGSLIMFIDDEIRKATQQAQNNSGFRDRMYDYDEQNNQWNNGNSNVFVDTKLQKSYKLLGVVESCTDDELKKSYRKLAKTYHPDRNPHGKEKMSEINEAYDYIRDKRGI